MSSTIKPTVWTGCYESSWKGVITNESFAHPAKMSRDLLERIIRHGFERGWWKKGDTIGDCFCGVGTTAIVGTYAGLRVVCVELEPRFVELAKANFEWHASKWLWLGYDQPRIIQGDSRQFDRIVAEADAVITSPPFTQGYKSGGGINVKGYGPNGEDKIGQRTYQSQGGIRQSENIEILPAGQLAAVVTSPPWEKNSEGGRAASKFKSPAAALKSKRGHGASDAAVLAQAARDEKKVYGESKGQIGQEKSESYWDAVFQVYKAVYRSLKPGGVFVLVCKDYVKNRKRVPLCDDTARLLEHCGFVVIERIHAMLVSETTHGDLFNGETTKKTSRKSFFRRLAEANGSPEINFEEVIVAQKL